MKLFALTLAAAAVLFAGSAVAEEVAVEGVSAPAVVLDADGNGSVTAEEFAAAHPEGDFAAADANKDGSLDAAEVAALEAAKAQ